MRQSDLFMNRIDNSSITGMLFWSSSRHFIGTSTQVKDVSTSSTALPMFCHVPSPPDPSSLFPPSGFRWSGAGHQCQRSETQTLVRMSQKQREESGVLAYAHTARSPEQWQAGLDHTRHPCIHTHVYTHSHAHTHTLTHTFVSLSDGWKRRPSHAVIRAKDKTCNNNNVEDEIRYIMPTITAPSISIRYSY